MASDVISRALSSMWADQRVSRAPSLIRSVGLIKSYCRTETPHTQTHTGPCRPYLSAGEIISDARLPEYSREVGNVRATRGTSKPPIKDKRDLERG